MITLLKENEKGRTYQTDHCRVLYRNAGTTAGDNKINPHELLYLVQGEARMTLEDKTRDVVAPAEVVFPANTYHKIEALSDIVLLVFEQ